MKILVAQASRLFKFCVPPNFVYGKRGGFSFAARADMAVSPVSGATPETTGETPVLPKN